MPNVGLVQYARAMEGAREDVYVVATRRSLKTESIKVQFDPGRGPGPHAAPSTEITANRQKGRSSRNLCTRWFP